MKPTVRIVLFSASLLAVSCTKTTDTVVPAKPDDGQPKAPAPQPKTPDAAAPAPDAKTPAPAAPTIADLGKVLAGIKDGPTATAAKGSLDGIATQLEAAKKAAPAPAGKDALGGVTKMATDAAAKLGVSADTVKQIEALLKNDSVKAVIGPTLEKLQNLLK